MNKDDILDALGESVDSTRVENLISAVGEVTVERIEAPESKRFYLQYYPAGLSLLFDEEGVLSTVFCYLVPEEGFDAYPHDTDELCGVNKDCNSSEVIEEIGEASAYTPKGNSAYNFPIPEWARYDFNEYSIHFSFLGDNAGISRIAFMRSDVVPK